MKAGRPLRGPEPEGSGFAAAHLLRAAARQAGGRAVRGYGAAPPASRLLRTAARRNAASLSPIAGRQPVPVTFGLQAVLFRAGMAELL